MSAVAAGPQAVGCLAVSSLHSMDGVPLAQSERSSSAGCLTSQQHASVSQGRICSDNCTCCHTETEVADQNLLPHPVTVY